MDAPPDSLSKETLERSRTSATELSWSLRAIIRAATDLDQALAVKVELRPLDYAAFMHVMSAGPDPIGPAELGQRLGITTGSATELVDRLERAHHIRRERSTKDRRRISLLPEEAAVRKVLSELAPFFSSLDDLASEFDTHDQAIINRYLRSATERLVEHTEALSS